MPSLPLPARVFFFFNETATTEIYTLSLHDALPISTSAPHVTHTYRFRASIRYQFYQVGWRMMMLTDAAAARHGARSEEHTSELQSQSNLVCRLLLEKKKYSCSA